MIIDFCKKILARLDTKRSKLLTYNEIIVTEKKEISLPSRIESVDDAAVEAEKFVRSLGFGDDLVSAVDLAVRESVANAVKHGNAFDEKKNVEISFADSPTEFQITVRDFGNGFDPDEIPDPTNPDNLLKASGRGILFMRSFMDDVFWKKHEEGGMIVTMKKQH
jgi:serine/threonine-protein kinase RsbW